jgi:hypothetical protein
MLDDNYLNSDSSVSSSKPDQAPVENQPQVPLPPAGDSEKAEKYLGQLIDLINQDKLVVYHTDLKKFEIALIQDHYRMDLDEYEVEINHSKQPDSGQDFYVLLFNNLKKIEEGGESCVNKVILAYTHLTENQFQNFKEAADGAIERARLREEEKRFKEAMAPIDNILSDMASSEQKEEVEEKTEEPQEDLANFEEANKPLTEDDLVNDDNEPKASDFQTQPQSTL